MKKITLALLALVAGTALFAHDGEALFDEKCAVCHIKTRPTPETRSSLVAPPIMGVMMHVKEAFPGNREGALAFIKAYVVNPSAEKAVCPSIRRFGMMPSLKGAVTDAELDAIAGYVYAVYPPKDFHPGCENGNPAPAELLSAPATQSSTQF